MWNCVMGIMLFVWVPDAMLLCTWHFDIIFNLWKVCKYCQVMISSNCFSLFIEKYNISMWPFLLCLTLLVIAQLYPAINYLLGYILELKVFIPIIRKNWILLQRNTCESLVLSFFIPFPVGKNVWLFLNIHSMIKNWENYSRKFCT